MGVDPDETILAQVDNELKDASQEEHHASGENNEETIQGEIIRNTISAEMWVNYIE